MEKFISGAILTKGISKDGLTNLLNGIEYAVIDEGLDVITEEANNIIEVIRKNKPGEETEEWIKKFKDQIDVLDKIIEINIGKIEIIFERVFKDWEEYQKENINVIELKENEEVNNEENPESMEEKNEDEPGVEEEKIESEDVAIVEEKEEQVVVEDEESVDLEVEIPVDHIETDDKNEEEPAIEEKDDKIEGEKDE